MKRLLCVLPFLLWPLATEAAVARTGTPITAVREGVSATTLTSSAQTVTTGNTLVVVAYIYSPGAEEMTFADSGGVNTYTAGTACEDGGNNRFRAFYALNITGGSLTFTLTPSGATGWAAFVVSEYSGVSAIDVEVPCATGTGLTLTSGTFSTTAAGAVVVGGLSSNTLSVMTAGTNYTGRTDDWGTGRGLTEDRITTGAVTTTTATMSQDDVAANWLIAGWSLKAATATAVTRAGTPVTATREGVSGTTLTSAAQAVTTGNTLVVMTYIYSPGAEEITFADSGGVNTYTAGTACEDAGNNRFRAFYAINITGGSLTFTLTPSGTTSWAAMVVSEYSGISAVDVEVPCTTGTGLTLTSGTFSTTQAGAVVVGALSNNTLSVMTAGTNYTARTDDWGTGRGLTEDRITTGALTTTTATMSQDDVVANWLIAGWSFKTTTVIPAATSWGLLGVWRGGASITISGYSLLDSYWDSATNGWGPAEENRDVGNNEAGDYSNGPDTDAYLALGCNIAGSYYARCLGVHAASTLIYALPASATRFTACIGVPDEVTTGGSVIFSVSVDGVTKYTSATLTSASAIVCPSVTLTGGTNISLIVTDAGDGTANDHASWGDPKFYGASTPPITCTATITAGGTSNNTSAWNTAIAATTTGQTICVGAGDHRILSALTGGVSRRWRFLNGARMLGSQRLATFTLASCGGGSNNCWYSTETTAAIGNTNCQPGWERCGYLNEVFLDGSTRMQHMTAIPNCAGGAQWFYDTVPTPKRIYVCTNPSGHTYDISKQTYGFELAGSSSDATQILCGRNGGTAGKIWHWSNDAQAGGAVGGASGSSSNVVVRDCDLSYSHGINVRVGTRWIMTNNQITHGGQMGIGGTCTSCLIEGNNININNEAHYSYGWEAGSTKFTFSTNLIFRRNNCSNATGPGCWLDIKNVGYLLEGNAAYNNDSYSGTFNAVAGIVIEISAGGTIRNNTVYDNGLTYLHPQSGGDLWPAQILITSSGGCDSSHKLLIYNNQITSGSAGISIIGQDRAADETGYGGSTCADGQFRARHTEVYGNTVKTSYTDSMAEGATSDASPVTEGIDYASISFHNNIICGPTGTAFAWMATGWRNYAAWLTYHPSETSYTNPCP